MITLLSVSWSWWQISLLVFAIIGIVMMAFALMLFGGVKELERAKKEQREVRDEEGEN